MFDGRAVVARHQRIVAGSGQSVQLDHYLEVLKTKPGALPGSTALARARESGAFTSAHEAFWAASRRVNGDADGTRELIDVLLLHRSMDAGDVQAGITAALVVGAVSADVVAVEARRHATVACRGWVRFGPSSRCSSRIESAAGCQSHPAPAHGPRRGHRRAPAGHPARCRRSGSMTSCWPNAPNTP